MKLQNHIANVKQKLQSKEEIKSFALMVVGVGLVIYSCVFLITNNSTSNKPSEPIDQNTIVDSTDAPEENKPDCDSYKVAPGAPRKINLPDINVDGCIMQVGIDQNNAIAVPNNIHLAGWYTNSVLPGQRGLSIIDGHASGKYNPGIFNKLGQMKKGNTFSIEFGDGSIKKFEVVSINSYTTEETTQKMFEPVNSAKSQLNLITCTGNYDKKTREYDKRILVVSKLVEN